MLSLIVTAALLCDAQKQSGKSKNKSKLKTKPSATAPLELEKAKRCSPSKCKLPDCRCSDATLPRAKFKDQIQQIPQVCSVADFIRHLFPSPVVCYHYLR